MSASLVARSLCALSCLCWLPAQGRLATIGRLVDADGAPLAAADVTFATSPPGVYDAFAQPELVSVRTDDAGRFRAMLRPGMPHSVWAVGSRGERQWLGSAVQEGVLAGSVLELRAVVREPMTKLHVQDIARLGQGPFVVQLRSGARHGPVWTVRLDGDGEAELPVMPAGELLARVVDSGSRVRIGSLGIHQGQAVVPPARTCHFTVVDAGGKPLAGAHVALAGGDAFGAGDEPFVQQREWEFLVEAPPTDAAGHTQLQVHNDIGGFDISYFVAWAEGRAQTVSGIMNGTWVQDGEFCFGDPRGSVGLPEQMTFNLAPATPLRGRVHRGALPVAGLGVQLRVNVQVVGRGTTCSFPQTRTRRTDGNGEFAFDSVPTPIGSLQLSFATDVDEPPVLLLPQKQVLAAALDLDLERLPVQTLQLFDASNGPPPAARVVLWPGDLALPADSPIVLTTDRAGRVRARLQAGAWLLFATDGEGWAAQRLEVGSAATTTALHLAALARMSGVVRQADGSPSVGIGFHFNAIEWDRLPADADDFERLLREHAAEINRGLTAPVRTDAAGRFLLRFVPLPGVRMKGWPSRGDWGDVVLLREATDVVVQLLE